MYVLCVWIRTTERVYVLWRNVLDFVMVMVIACTSRVILAVMGFCQKWWYGGVYGNKNGGMEAYTVTWSFCVTKAAISLILQHARNFS